MRHADDARPPPVTVDWCVSLAAALALALAILGAAEAGLDALQGRPDPAAPVADR